ncbi:MAG TPA: phosphoglucosamine mutase [Blastocatellia bacterium]|nr:phosphoglucosamine mutase [Blastocatellia bacterium]
MAEGFNERLFGTDGIRGVAGVFPLDESTVERIGRSLAENLKRDLGHDPALIIGRDTRESGPRLEEWLARGAVAAGARVESAGVITTPGVAFLARTIPFDAGVVISASHNPYRDNGIKVFSRSGKKISDEMEARIERDVARSSRPDAPSGSPGEMAGEGSDLEFCSTLPLHREQYISYLVGDVSGGLSLGGMRLALDCANGAASFIAPEIFKRLGAEVEVICASPDGQNINENCGSLHTEGLRSLVVEGKFDLGIAFDGDADRALFIDERGDLVDGDHTLLVLADHMKLLGVLGEDTVVSTVMGNLGLELALRERGIKMVRAQVGDRFVLEELIALNAKLGGEQSGHIIFPDISLAGDGLITAIELLRVVRDSGRTLGELAASLTKFPQVLVNVRVPSKPPLERLSVVMDLIEKIEREMEGRGRLLVRYSGTENLARVMIEGEDFNEIQRHAALLARTIKESIESLAV